VSPWEITIKIRKPYSQRMQVEAKEKLAMVLPLPVSQNSSEKEMHFIDLSRYPGFFADLAAGFPVPPSANEMVNMAALGAKLEVQSVGSFDASFVPTIKDFDRLDSRFRLPKGTWDKLPQYVDYGFAVFKLKPKAELAHPMAFSFPRRQPDRLFFPTVHIHDGKVHEKAHFDHVLYCQRGSIPLAVPGWEESPQLAGSFVDATKANGIIDASEHCYRKKLHGELPNRDTFVLPA
jgi:hypothetical protein